MGNRKKRVVISVLIVLVIIAVSCILNVPANKIKIVLNIWGDEFKENSIQALENESAKECTELFRMVCLKTQKMR